MLTHTFARGVNWLNALAKSMCIAESGVYISTARGYIGESGVYIWQFTTAAVNGNFLFRNSQLSPVLTRRATALTILLTTSTSAKASHKFSWNATTLTWYVRLERRYCFPAASHYPDRFQPYIYIISLARRLIQDSARTSLYLTSRCHQCQLNCEAGRFTVSSNHCSMIASFRERLGSKS